MIKIDKGIPIPAPQAPRTKPPKFPIAELGVGDSFAVEAEDGKTIRVRTNLRMAMYRYMRGEGAKKKFTIRVVDEKTVRIWRIK